MRMLRVLILQAALVLLQNNNVSIDAAQSSSHASLYSSLVGGFAGLLLHYLLPGYVNMICHSTTELSPRRSLLGAHLRLLSFSSNVCSSLFPSITLLLIFLLYHMAQCIIIFPPLPYTYECSTGQGSVVANEPSCASAYHWQNKRAYEEACRRSNDLQR